MPRAAAALLVWAMTLGLGACAHVSAPDAASEASPAAPAFLIVLGEVHDREAFMRDYVAKLPPLYERYGGRYLAIGRGAEMLEGGSSYQSYVLAEWPSMEAARAFWNSPEYDALRRARIEGGWGSFDVVLIEGLPRE